MTSEDIIAKRVALLTDAHIEEIRVNAGLDSNYTGSVFRPTPDNGLLIFKDKNDKKSKSVYTVNLDTLRPTLNSINKTPLPEAINKILA